MCLFIIEYFSILLKQSEYILHHCAQHEQRCIIY